MRHHGVFKALTGQRRKTDWALSLTNDRRRCAKQSAGTGKEAWLVWWGLGKLPKGDPGTGVMGLSLSGRGGGDGTPRVGKRVAMTPSKVVLGVVRESLWLRTEDNHAFHVPDLSSVWFPLLQGERVKGREDRGRGRFGIL